MSPTPVEAQPAPPLAAENVVDLVGGPFREAMLDKIAVVHRGQVTEYQNPAIYERALLRWAREHEADKLWGVTAPTGDQLLVIHGGEVTRYSCPGAFAEAVETAQAHRRRSDFRARLTFHAQRVALIVGLAAFALAGAWVVGPSQ